jgi:tRNA threonylcarbamoyladenosine biosynthesis protein TsaE
VIFLNENDINKINELFNTTSSFEYEYTSLSEDDTKKLGLEFAKHIKKGDIITLNGELGSGKTVFLMGIASYFNIENDVCSPTFTIVNEYNINKDFPIFHFDVYRLKDSDEFLEGVGTDYFYNGACLIEWGDEVILDILPKNTIHIDITKDSEKTNIRKFKIWRA